jgi:hypothetical protein
VQVVEMAGFRAMSADGITWQVQVQGRGPRVSGHGVWRADGSGDLIETERTRTFLAALRALPPLPFPLADRLELWLLEARSAAPLALLASAPPPAAPPRVVDAHWQAALGGDDSFVAPSLGGTASPIPHREVISRVVQKAAGPRPHAQWFRRDEHGHGTGLGGRGLDAALGGRRLPSEAFPELLLREDWPDATERALARDYHDWQAPALLTHSDLRRGTRDRLEHAACRQAEKLYRVRQLLPEVINPDLIKVAMVEAVLRRASANG